PPNPPPTVVFIPVSVRLKLEWKRDLCSEDDRGAQQASLQTNPKPQCAVHMSIRSGLQRQQERFGTGRRRGIRFGTQRRQVNLGLTPHQPAGGAVPCTDSTVVFLGVTSQLSVTAHGLYGKDGITDTTPTGAAKPPLTFQSDTSEENRKLLPH
ncbi:hypothetical protein A6R68_11416, partial [Neotoma lepida]